MDPPYSFDSNLPGDPIDRDVFNYLSSHYNDDIDSEWLHSTRDDQGHELTDQTDSLQGLLRSPQFPDDNPLLSAPGHSTASVHPGSPLNVSQWLEGAYRPPVPCSHCSKYRLQCLILRTTEANPNPTNSCSSCVALFRECSLARGEKRSPSQFETEFPVLGHLHGVPEYNEDGGGRSAQSFDSTGKSQNKDSKHFVRKGARVLREWFHQHQEYPYPTEEQKLQLSRETGFSQRRISIWFANARRRQRQQQRSSTLSSVPHFPSGSPMVTSTLSAMTPLDRWRASPPEDEPASESAIRNAIASTRLEASSGDDALFPIDGSVEDLFDFEEASSHLPSSASSFGSRASETSDSISSAWSHHSTGDGGLPFPLLPKRTRKRRSRDEQQHSGQMGRYQCTFCVRTFKKKHDWSRHEKSIHLAPDSWICTPDLAYIQQLMKPESLECSFCESPFPTTGHWDEHDFHICATKPVSERSFSRRDHLWQHLRKFHGCTKPPVPDLDVWRGTGANVRSRCGFCGDSLSTWTARVDHLAAHFREGCHMGQWDGDWGLDPSALSMLRNAVLPSERPSS